LGVIVGRGFRQLSSFTKVAEDKIKIQN